MNHLNKSTRIIKDERLDRLQLVDIDTEKRM